MPCRVNKAALVVFLSPISSFRSVGDSRRRSTSMGVAVQDDDWRLGHRPGLDGLRGIAIGLVLLLHWWPDIFPGGDTGVDLFFVLSGFLITRLLVEEIWRDGTVYLRRFYVRRFRRLMPASTLLVLACIATPGAIWVVLYSANWARIGGVLRGGPLEHTWSLAIEEQFYLVWPPLLLALVRLARPWIFVILLAMLVALHRVSLPPEDWLHAVAGTDTRADALLIGGAMALAMRHLENIRNRSHLALAVIPGFVLVLFGEFGLAGWGFTLTALGWAVVVLWSLDTSGWITSRPLRRLGELSYSLYLWHYPVTWLLRDGDLHNTTPIGTGLAIIGSFAAAYLSYRFVEQRFRGQRLTPAVETPQQGPPFPGPRRTMRSDNS